MVRLSVDTVPGTPASSAVFTKAVPGVKVPMIWSGVLAALSVMNSKPVVDVAQVPSPILVAMGNWVSLWPATPGLRTKMICWSAWPTKEKSPANCGLDAGTTALESGSVRPSVTGPDGPVAAALSLKPASAWRPSWSYSATSKRGLGPRRMTG
jgi:hypothetical protein